MEVYEKMFRNEELAKEGELPYESLSARDNSHNYHFIYELLANTNFYFGDCYKKEENFVIGPSTADIDGYRCYINMEMKDLDYRKIDTTYEEKIQLQD